MTLITRLTTEYRPNPLGIDVVSPRFAWQMETDRQGARQTAYRLMVASDPAWLLEGRADLWDSGKVESDQSTQVAFSGEKLRSRQRVFWKVTVWDEAGNAFESDVAWFEMGLLERSEWSAEWIGTALRGGPRSTVPAPYLHKKFELTSTPKAARLYITALGLYECTINGQPVGDDVLAPGWTDYHKRVQYMVYDVTDHLSSGENVIGAILGDGWAVGHMGWTHRQHYIDRPRLLAQLEITLADGSVIAVSTDSSWKYQFSAITSSDLMMGEDYDARLEIDGWDQPHFDDSDWSEVETFEDSGAVLAANNGPTIRRIQELAPISDPVEKGRLSASRYVFDLGQNMVGWVRFKGSAPADTTITLRFAEVLNPDGTIYTTNLRTARATDYFTFKDDGEVEWEPKFTFHGFRYVELRDYPGIPTRDTITGIVVHSDMAPIGTFECSDPLINQLQSNIVWGQKGNFVDVPTDCPQRDERLGWTGDIQVFARTAAFNMDVAGFMTKWAQDLADAQDEQGVVPPVVPKMQTSFLPDGGPAWADAAIICPWTMYLSYGDTRILETNYVVMSKFMNFLIETSPNYIRCAPDYDGWHGFGDWLSINASTPRDLIGTAFFAYDANLMAQIAAVLGKADDVERYQQLFVDVKEAFAKRFLVGSEVPVGAAAYATELVADADRLSHGSLKAVDYGTINSEVFNADFFKPSQTSYVLALHFELLPEEMRPLAVAELVADIERRGMHLSTGFVGSPYLPHVLTNGERTDAAYELLKQKSWPSWLYSVTQGATTIWERWDGWTEDNGFQTPEMNSFNHYAYGAIGAWLYNTIAGIEIDPMQPGYKHSILRPQPGGGLTYASGTLKTPYGELVSRWRIEGGKFDWTVIVPPNSSATLHLPSNGTQQISVNGEYMSGLIHEVEAGTYHIVVG